MPAPKDPRRRAEWIRKRMEKMQGRFVGENNPFYGKHHTEETKRIISDKKVEYYRNLSDFDRRRFGDYRRGKKHTEEEKNKVSATLLGRERPDEVRLKIKRGLVGVFYVDDEELDEFSRALERFRQRGETYRCAHCGQRYRPAFRNHLFSVFCCPKCRDEWNAENYPAQIRPLSRV